jgi:membrane-associated phospholipid phosphatase
MAYTYINVYVGIVFILLGIVIGVTRVLAGVHFIRDVFAGAVISILIGTIFLFLI